VVYIVNVRIFLKQLHFSRVTSDSPTEKLISVIPGVNITSNITKILIHMFHSINIRKYDGLSDRKHTLENKVRTPVCV
jgi:hypothetical protein